MLRLYLLVIIYYTFVLHNKDIHYYFNTQIYLNKKPQLIVEVFSERCFMPLITTVNRFRFDLGKSSTANLYIFLYLLLFQFIKIYFMYLRFCAHLSNMVLLEYMLIQWFCDYLSNMVLFQWPINTRLTRYSVPFHQ